MFGLEPGSYLATPGWLHQRISRTRALLNRARLAGRALCCLSGDCPGYFGHLIPDSAIGGPSLKSLVVAQGEPFARAAMQRLSVGVSQLELDMFLIGFHRFGADSEFLCDPAGAEPGATERKDM